nr:hypothetical protein [uncultured Pedobacter sp.]
MKKFFFSAFVMLTSFVLFSFTMVSKTQGVYDTVTGNLVFNSGLAASFTEYNSSGTDKDVKWKDWHKNWTSITQASDVKLISDELASIQP